MSILKEVAIAVPAMVLLLFVSNTFLGPDESYRPTTGPKSWLGGEPVPPERFLAKNSMTGGASPTVAEPSPLEWGLARDLTPKARVRDVFAQFVTSERRRAL
jgi:hypothetical protein